MPKAQLGSAAIATVPAVASAANPPRIGEWIRLDDSAWVVNGAGDFGRRLPSDNDDGATTTGKFIVVRYGVYNVTNRQERILNDPELIDGNGRRFRAYDGQGRYLTKAGPSITMEALPPGVSREFWAIYEVAADAHDLAFEARALALGGEKRTVPLGNIPTMKH